MALTGDVYANEEDSSSEGGTAEMENNNFFENNSSTAADVPVDDASDDDGNIDEHIKLTATRLKEHNEQIIESEFTPQQNTDEKEAAVSSAGAGLLFGLSGLIIGGPILGTIAGVSSAFIASNNHGQAGECARAAGTFAVTTGSKVGAVARDVNEKHGILDWIKNVFTSGWGEVRKFDEQHHTSEKVKETMSTVSDRVVGFEREHHLFENMLEGIQSGVQFLLEKVKGASRT
jgi:hypothetical protein